MLANHPFHTVRQGVPSEGPRRNSATSGTCSSAARTTRTSGSARRVESQHGEPSAGGCPE